jgi:two-component system LytT family sensor kinase
LWGGIVHPDGILFVEAARLVRVDDAGARGDKGGIGMKNVQERLEVLYGNQASFTVDSSPGRGTRVSIELPVSLPETR